MDICDNFRKTFKYTCLVKAKSKESQNNVIYIGPSNTSYAIGIPTYFLSALHKYTDFILYTATN